MAFRLTYTFTMQWVGPGQAPLQGLPNAQSLKLFNAAGGQNVAGAGAGGTLTGGDVTTLTNAMAADAAAQLNAAANLGVINGWPTGTG